MTTTASLAALLAFAGINLVTGSVFGIMLAKMSTQPWKALAFLGLLLTVLSNWPILLIVFFATGNVWLLIVTTFTDIAFIAAYSIVYTISKRRREDSSWQ